MPSGNTWLNGPHLSVHREGALVDKVPDVVLLLEQRLALALLLFVKVLARADHLEEAGMAVILQRRAIDQLIRQKHHLGVLAAKLSLHVKAQRKKTS